MEDELNFLYMEEDLNFLYLEDDLNFFINGRQSQLFYKWKMTSTFFWMEDDLIFNLFLYHTKNLNLDLGDQSKVFKYFKLRWPPMEVNLKILKVEYLSNQILDYTQILNLSLDDQTIFF